MTTASGRRLIASAAAEISWARTSDRAARIQPSHDRQWQGWLDKAQLAIPDRALTEAELVEGALRLRRAHMRLLAARSAAARSTRGN